jgi:hypothetical protein
LVKLRGKPDNLFNIIAPIIPKCATTLGEEFMPGEDPVREEAAERTVLFKSQGDGSSRG